MSNETLYQSAVKAAQDSLNTREIKQGREHARLGDVVGNLVGPSGVPWVWARILGDASRRVEAYNGTPLTPAFDMPVTLLVRYENGRATRYDIEGYDTGVTWANYTPGSQGGVGSHHLSHEGTTGGGWDLVNVYPLNMTMLRCDPQVIADLTLQIAPGMFSINGVLCYYAGGTSPAFTPPGSGSEYQVLSINAGGVLTITASGLTYPPFSMSIPADNIPIAAPYLTAGQTAITASDLLFDPRPFLSLGGSGTSDPLALLDSDGTTLLDSDGNMLDANT